MSRERQLYLETLSKNEVEDTDKGDSKSHRIIIISLNV